MTLKIDAELAFIRWAEADGWSVTKRGWPDFMCRRGDERMAVEVKYSDWLQDDQQATLIDLHAIGLPTFVWQIGSGLVAWPREQPLLLPATSDLLAEIAALTAERDALTAERERLVTEVRQLRDAALNDRVDATRRFAALRSDLIYVLKRMQPRRRQPSSRLMTITSLYLSSRGTDGGTTVKEPAQGGPI